MRISGDDKHIAWVDFVLELLCFGWIDMIKSAKRAATRAKRLKKPLAELSG